MDEKRIATLKAELLHIYSNWGHYSTIDPSHGLLTEEHSWPLLEAKTKELAISRAAVQNRDFDAVFNEVQLNVYRHMAALMDPAMEGTKTVRVEEEGQVCGVCLEEMGRGEEGIRAMDCMHAFHESCILEWLHLKRTCPLCRHVLVPKEITVTDVS